MQSKPIDTGRLAVCLCMTNPEPKLDTMTGAPKVDRDGVAQWVVGVAVRAVDARRSDAAVIDVVIPGQPEGVSEGMLVRLVDLWSNDWAIDGRTGTSWRAAAVVPAGAARPAASGGSGSRKSGGES